MIILRVTGNKDAGFLKPEYIRAVRQVITLRANQIEINVNRTKTDVIHTNDRYIDEEMGVSIEAMGSNRPDTLLT